MKKLILILTSACAGLAANAQNIDISFVGSFNSGALNGQEILGSIEIDTLVNASGTARPLPGALVDGSEGILSTLSFTFFAPGPVPVLPPSEVTFDLSDTAVPVPTASFDTFGSSTLLTGFTYFAQDGSASLTAVYDGTQNDINSAVFFQYNDGNGNISGGTLELPAPVPEPSTYAAIFGLLTLAWTMARRRK